MAALTGSRRWIEVGARSGHLVARGAERKDAPVLEVRECVLPQRRSADGPCGVAPSVPAGTFETIVIRPIIKARGIFSEDGRAEVWLTDDDKRLMVQMKSQMKVGSLNLYLRSYTPAPPAASSSDSTGAK